MAHCSAQPRLTVSLAFSVRDGSRLGQGEVGRGGLVSVGLKVSHGIMSRGVGT